MSYLGSEQVFRRQYVPPQNGSFERSPKSLPICAVEGISNRILLQDMQTSAVMAQTVEMRYNSQRYFSVCCHSPNKTQCYRQPFWSTYGFYSILLCSTLFYSILFCSVLLYTAALTGKLWVLSWEMWRTNSWSKSWNLATDIRKYWKCLSLRQCFTSVGQETCSLHRPLL
jgi:hypothetical protein